MVGKVASIGLFSALTKEHIKQNEVIHHVTHNHITQKFEQAKLANVHFISN